MCHLKCNRAIQYPWDVQSPACLLYLDDVLFVFRHHILWFSLNAGVPYLKICQRQKI